MKYTNWTTVFDNEKNKIIHSFESGRLSVITDQKEHLIEVYKDNKVIESFTREDTITVDQYHTILVMIAKADYELLESEIEKENNLISA